MTIEQFHQASTLQDQISDVGALIEQFEKFGEFACEPITRQSGVYIRFGIHENSPAIQLSQGEARFIKDSLESYANILRHQFDKL